MTGDKFRNYIHEMKIAADNRDADKVEELLHEMLGELGIAPWDFPEEAAEG